MTMSSDIFSMTPALANDAADLLVGVLFSAERIPG
jgi:hypothetical protein